MALACRNVYKALGLTVHIDVDSLRSGQIFSHALMRLIDASDVFQLFWSARASQSAYVRQEWEYALAHSKGEGFIRPVYWEKPMEAPSQALSGLHFAYIELPLPGSKETL